MWHPSSEVVPMSHRIVNTTGTAIPVVESGAGEPALIFLHYWGGSSRTWRGVIERYINAPERRREASHAGREAVAARHTYEGEGWKWCEAWEFARARRMART